MSGLALFEGTMFIAVCWRSLAVQVGDEKPAKLILNEWMDTYPGR